MASDAPILAANTLAYSQLPFATACEEIAKAGYAWIEPTFIAAYLPDLTDDFFCTKNAVAVTSAARSQGLQIYGVSAHMDLGSPDAVDAFSKRMDFAAEVGARIVISNATTTARENEFYRNMERLVRRAETSDLMIALENPGDGTDSLLADAESAGVVFAHLDSERVKLNYDVSNIYSYSEGRADLHHETQLAAPLCCNVHLKNLAEKNGVLTFVGVGEGLHDYSLLVELFQQHGKPLPLAVELPTGFHRGAGWKIKPNEHSPSLGSIRETLSNSLEYVVELLNRIGARDAP